MYLTKDDLFQRMRLLVFGGLLGAVNGRVVTHNTASEDDLTITFIAALISPRRAAEEPVERYLIQLAKTDGNLISIKPAALKKEELSNVLVAANVGTLKSFTLLNQGSCSVTYKASIWEEETKQYIVQLRYHGNVSSMNTILRYIGKNASTDLPVPEVYALKFQAECGLDVQVSQFISGTLGDSLYFDLPHDEKTAVVRQIARAFGELWGLQLPRAACLIGEAMISGEPPSVSVGCDRQYGYGGPFSSVSSYLQAWIKHRMAKLEEQQNIDEFKKDYLSRIRTFVDTELSRIPLEVEQVPIVITHRDMGLHNMIFSTSKPVKLMAIIDWEFTYCLPFPSAVPTLINPLFQKNSTTRRGDEDVCEEEELRRVFWEEIPEWKKLMDSSAAKTFLDWYEFGVLLKADAPPHPKASIDEKCRLWRKNVTFIDTFLRKWGDEEHFRGGFM